MNIVSKTYNTLPRKTESWWQFVVLPTISIMNSLNDNDEYIAINVEWLFWSFTTIISYGKGFNN